MEGMGRLLMSAIIAVISSFFRRWTTKRRAVNSGTEQTDSKRFRGNVWKKFVGEERVETD